MRKKSHESHTLVEPQRALRVYLDALLGEVDLISEPDVTTRIVDDPALEKALERATEFTPDPDSTKDAEANEAPARSARIATPDWAQGSFQCLSFQVAGVTLAAPLEKLHGIVELTEEITELPGYAPWVIGLLPNRGQNVQVVDVAQIIMPDEAGSVFPPASERMKFIILLDDGKFGLAADSISQVLSLEEDAVRWRGAQSKRPWLAGTVIEQMCALLEIDLLAEQLRAGLKGV